MYYKNENASALSRFLGIYDVKHARSWRLDDTEHRSQEIQHRNDLIKLHLEWRREDIERTRRIHKLANERRLVDSRSWQLSSVSQMSILVSIFGSRAYVETHLPESTHPTIVFLQGTLSAAAMVCTLLCALRSFMLTVATLNYASSELENELKLVKSENLDVTSPFNHWWHYRCETYWRRTYQYFRAGIFFLVIAIALANFSYYQWSWYSVGILSTVMIICWLWRMESKWRKVMECSSPYRHTVDTETHSNAHEPPQCNQST